MSRGEGEFLERVAMWGDDVGGWGMREIAKGWGSELVIHDGDGYTFKVLRFRGGSEGSLHLHLKKTETWYVTRGWFDVRLLDGQGVEYGRELWAGDFLHLPAGTVHQVRCLEEGEIMEASTPHTDEDVVRVRPGDSQR